MPLVTRCSLGDLAPVLRDAVAKSGDSQPGVVDQDVDRHRFLLNPINKGGNPRRVGEVRGMGGAPELGCQRPKCGSGMTGKTAIVAKMWPRYGRSIVPEYIDA